MISKGEMGGAPKRAHRRLSGPPFLGALTDYMLLAIEKTENVCTHTGNTIVREQLNLVYRHGILSFEETGLIVYVRSRRSAATRGIATNSGPTRCIHYIRH